MTLFRKITQLFSGKAPVEPTQGAQVYDLWSTEDRAIATPNPSLYPTCYSGLPSFLALFSERTGIPQIIAVIIKGSNTCA